MEKVIKLINVATAEIQKLVDMEFAKVGGNPHPDSPLNQVNLLGGDRIVHEYNEVGITFDHLNYMVEETGIKLTPNMKAKLAEISKIIS